MEMQSEEDVAVEQAPESGLPIEPLVWEKKSDATGFNYSIAADGEFVGFKSKTLDVPHWEFSRNKKLIGFFPDADTGSKFIDQCRRTGQWPERHVDQRKNLEELKAYVAQKGEEARIIREAQQAEREEREAEQLRLAQVEAARLAQAEAERKARIAAEKAAKKTKAKPKVKPESSPKPEKPTRKPKAKAKEEPAAAEAEVQPSLF